MTSPGILTGDEIRLEIAAGHLIKNHVDAGIQGCSYDLRIGTIFSEDRIIRRVPNGQDQDPIIVPPGGIISLFTLEDLDLPDDVSATAFAMNFMSSEGVLVLNPGHVDPGFKGPLTVRILNVRATSKALLFGTPIFTVIFQRLPKSTKPYSRNKSREQRELDFKAKDVEQNPKTLVGLINAGKDKPLMTVDEVDKRIREHWISNATVEDIEKRIRDHWVSRTTIDEIDKRIRENLITKVTFFAAVIAAVFAVIVAVKPEKSSQPPGAVGSLHVQPSAQPSPSESPTSSPTP